MAITNKTELINRIAEEAHLTEDDIVSLKYDINNFKAEEWLAVVLDECSSDTIRQFGKLIGIDIAEIHFITADVRKHLNLSIDDAVAFRNNLMNYNISGWTEIIKEKCPPDVYDRYIRYIKGPAPKSDDSDDNKSKSESDENDSANIVNTDMTINHVCEYLVGKDVRKVIVKISADKNADNYLYYTKMLSELMNRKWLTPDQVIDVEKHLYTENGKSIAVYEIKCYRT